VLCEWRDFNGARQNCALGGGIEFCDRQKGNYVLAAASREAEEELGVIVEGCRLLDEFVSDSSRFHVVFVSSWTGTIPATNRDNQNELHWVPLDTFASTITIEAFRRIIEDLMTPSHRSKTAGPNQQSSGPTLASVTIPAVQEPRLR
jgi:hypothetical protein